MQTPTPKSYRIMQFLVALALAFGVAGFTISVTDDNNDGLPEVKIGVIKTKVNDTPGDGQPTIVTEVPADAVEEAKTALEDRLRDETPVVAEQSAPQQLEQVQQTVKQVQSELQPLSTAGASAGFAGCRTRFVSNQSSRGSTRPIWQVLHYTVSPNRPGWDDVNAIVALFDRFSSQASSNFIIDGEGNCAYIVPIERKPWTQAAGNPLSISYEIINSGSEAEFMSTPGYARLKSVMRQVAQRSGYSAPVRPGSVYPARAGIVQHKDGGLAWGGHVDITPYSKEQVIKILTTGGVAQSTCTKYDECHYNIKVLTTAERAAATTLLRERRVAHKNGGWSKVAPFHLERARAAKSAMQARIKLLKKLGLTNKANRRLRSLALRRIVTA